MAPEQLEGRASTASDVFAAGVVLHEMLTGRRLFKGANDPDTIERVQDAADRRAVDGEPEGAARSSIGSRSRRCRAIRAARPSAVEVAHALERYVGQAGFTIDEMRAFLRTRLPQPRDRPRRGDDHRIAPRRRGDPTRPPPRRGRTRSRRRRWRRRAVALAAASRSSARAAGDHHGGAARAGR